MKTAGITWTNNMHK